MPASAKTRERDLQEIAAACYHDPLKFTEIAYTWDQGDLKGFHGPRDVQAKFLHDWGVGIRERAFDGKTPVAPILMGAASGHGIGKSALAGMIENFIMTTRPFSKGTVTANTATQLETKTWAEVSKWTRRSIFREWFDIRTGRGNMKKNHVAYPDDWFSHAVTCRKENSEAFAGQHEARSTSFYIFDEASAVPREISEVASGGLTDGEPMWFQLGNYTRNSGYFHDIFTKLRKYWNTRTIDARDVPETNHKMFAEWAEAWGEDSDYFRVRVRGLPPRGGSLQFIPQNLVDDAATREVIIDLGAPLCMGVDVARFGGCETVISFRRGRDARCVPWVTLREADAREIQHVITTLAVKHHVNAVFIDGVGVGGPVYDNVAPILQGYGVACFDVQSGAKADEPKKYVNHRAEIYARYKLWLETGAIPDEDRIKQDTTVLEYGFSSAGSRLQLERKEDLIGRGEGSPDYSDSFVMTFHKALPRIDLQRTVGRMGPSSRVGDYDEFAV